LLAAKTAETGKIEELSASETNQPPTKEMSTTQLSNSNRPQDQLPAKSSTDSQRPNLSAEQTLITGQLDNDSTAGSEPTKTDAQLNSSKIRTVTSKLSAPPLKASQTYMDPEYWYHKGVVLNQN